MSTITAPNIPELLKETQTLLNAECRRRKFRLQIPENSYTIDDDWVIIVATPTKNGIRAYDYVEALFEVEKALCARGYEHVLLVPTMPA
ncbi:MAG: hypothetical protein NTX50_21470 [Candidatus Sumerlaeota bacterium]|nr:hypothetical protein [Candidatus Sumerlaeota bacterium]